MNTQNTDKLYHDFPDLYRQHTLSPQETCLCFGVECSNGWFQLIYNLSKKLMEIDPDVQAVQVKEKYGGLCFYIGFVNKDKAAELYAAIDEAEEFSYKICEACGKEGYPNSQGWIITLCEACRKARQVFSQASTAIYMASRDVIPPGKKEVYFDEWRILLRTASRELDLDMNHRQVLGALCAVSLKKPFGDFIQGEIKMLAALTTYLQLADLRKEEIKHVLDALGDLAVISLGVS